jgi:hypothetical protein
VIALEFLTYSGGLGRLISWRYFVFDTDGVYAVIVLVAAIAILINTPREQSPRIFHGSKRRLRVSFCRRLPKQQTTSSLKCRGGRYRD